MPDTAEETRPCKVKVLRLFKFKYTLQNVYPNFCECSFLLNYFSLISDMQFLSDHFLLGTVQLVVSS